VVVRPNGVIEVREATVLLRDGVRDHSVSPRYRRYTLMPGADLAATTPRIAAIAAGVWTPEVVDAWAATHAD
jgi:hypothetical protein